MENALKDIEDFTRQIVNDDKIPLMICRKHLVTLGSVRAVAENMMICILSILMHMLTFVMII